MKTVTEYERRFTGEAVPGNDSEEQNAGRASLDVARSYIARHPPLQGKKRLAGIQTSKPNPVIPRPKPKSLPVNNNGREYVILGDQMTRWPERGLPGATAPKTMYKLRKPRTHQPTLNQSNRIFTQASPDLVPNETRHHSRCKGGKSHKSNRKGKQQPMPIPAAVQGKENLSQEAGAVLKEPYLPAPAPQTDVNNELLDHVIPNELPNVAPVPALQKRAGLPVLSSEKVEKYRSEYRRQFVVKSLENLPLQSPLMNAAKFLKGNIDLKHFPAEIPNTEPPTEYRKQFPQLPSSAYAAVFESNSATNLNNNNDTDIISHAPSKPEIFLSPKSSDFILHSSKPVPHLPPTSVPESIYRTEYQSNFRPFDALKYEDGAFKEADPTQLIPSPSWFAEVVELREKATKYKNRFENDQWTKLKEVSKEEECNIKNGAEENLTTPVDVSADDVDEESKPIEAVPVSLPPPSVPPTSLPLTSLPPLFVPPTSAPPAEKEELSLNLGDENEDVSGDSLSSSISGLTPQEQVLLSEREDQPQGEDQPQPIRPVIQEHIDESEEAQNPTSEDSHDEFCDCGASLASQPQAPAFALPASTGNAKAAFQRERAPKKRLKPSFVPPTIHESMAATYKVRSPSPTDSESSSTSERSARSLSRARDILTRAKQRQKFWGKT